jgi:hypothetical protein
MAIDNETLWDKFVPPNYSRSGAQITHPRALLGWANHCGSSSQTENLQP